MCAEQLDPRLGSLLNVASTGPFELLCTKDGRAREGARQVADASLGKSRSTPAFTLSILPIFEML